MGAIVLFPLRSPMPHLGESQAGVFLFQASAQPPLPLGSPATHPGRVRQPPAPLVLPYPSSGHSALSCVPWGQGPAPHKGK